MNETFKQPKVLFFESKNAKSTTQKETLVKDIAGKIGRHVWGEEYFKDEGDIALQMIIVSKSEHERISGILKRLGELAGEVSNKQRSGQLKPIGLKATLDFISGKSEQPEIEAALKSPINVIWWKQVGDFLVPMGVPAGEAVNRIVNGDFAGGAKSWDGKPDFDKDIIPGEDLFGPFSGSRENPGYMQDEDTKKFDRELGEAMAGFHADQKKRAITKHSVARTKSNLFSIHNDEILNELRAHAMFKQQRFNRSLNRIPPNHYVIARNDFDDAPFGTERKPKAKVYHPRAPKPKFIAFDDYVAVESQKALSQGKIPPYALFKRMFSTILTNIVNQDPKAPDVSFKEFSDQTDLVFFTKDGAQICFYLSFKRDGCHLEKSPALTSKALTDEAYALLPRAFAFKVTPNYYYDYDARAEYKGERSKS